MSTLTRKIQLRRDTTANWTSANPVLSSGELAYDTTTKKFKIGDGTTAWTSLATFFRELTASELRQTAELSSSDTVAFGALTSTLATFTANAASSTPAIRMTGNVFTDGTGTTTKPMALIEPTGTTSTAWSTKGTFFGINAGASFDGNLIDLQIAASSKFKVTYNGAATFASGVTATTGTLSTGLTIGATDQIYADSGSLRIGTGSRTVYAGAIVLTRNLTGAGNAHGYDDNTTFAQTGGSAAYASFDARGQMTGANALDHYAGFQSDPTFSMSTTLARNYCFVSLPTITDGVLTDRYGAYIYDVSKSGDAVVTNNYAIYIASLTAGATLNYAIYTAGSTASYFGGTVTVGGLVTSTITPASTLTVAGTTGITYSGSTLNALVEIGTEGTSGGSLVVHTPSYSGSFPSGLGVSGTWTLGTLTSLVNVTAYGVNSGGDFKSVMAFRTTLNGTVAEGFRLTSAGNVVIGSTTDTGIRLQVTGSITSTATVTGLNVTATSTVQGGNVFGSGSVGASSDGGIIFIGGSADIQLKRGSTGPTWDVCSAGGLRILDAAGTAIVTAPSSASATGALATVRVDANYIYVCTAANTWKRVAIATW
jgi:hypothetical protein